MDGARFAGYEIAFDAQAGSHARGTPEPLRSLVRHRGTGLSPRALDRARSFIDTHLGEHMRLADLARAACVSRFHFARLFRQSTGQSPMRYVAGHRVERAKRLLAEGGRHISDVALETGFFDQSHLTRVFRRLVGVTPARFARASD